jgi:hypothetical protein
MIDQDIVNGISVNGNLRVTGTITLETPLSTTKSGTGSSSFGGNQLLKYGSSGKFVGISMNSSNQYPITVNSASEAGTAQVSRYLYDHGTAHRTTSFQYGISYTRNDGFDMVGFSNIGGNVTIYPFSQSLLSVNNSTLWDDNYPLIGTYTLPGTVDGITIGSNMCIYLKV